MSQSAAAPANGSVAVDPSISRTPIELNATDQPTVCVLCSHNCALRVDVEDGHITAVRADKNSAITQGYICNKGVTITEYIDHGQRLEQPLRRRDDGSFEPVDWDTAITEIAAKIKGLIDEHGPRSLALAGIGGQGNHMDAPYGTAFLRACGSRRWFNAYAQEKTQHHLIDSWMFDASPAAFLHAGAEHTNLMVVMGTNPKVSHRGHRAVETFKEMAKRDDCRVVVVDPRQTETSRSADAHVQLRPGTDAYLLTGIAATIVQNELFDTAFLEHKTEGFDTVRDLLSRVDVAEMAGRCGIEAGQLTGLAEDFAKAPAASVMFDLGVEQAPFSTLISYLIRLVACLTGNIGQPGGNHFIETFLPPTLSAGRHEEPERALASGIQSIRALGNFGMFSPTLLPEEVLSDHPERIRSLIVEGSNPLISYSDTKRWREAFDRLDLLVVIDPAFTESARMADYVLPVPVGYEKWEIAQFPKRHPQIDVQLRPPVVPARGQSLPEAEIYMRILEAMGRVEPPPEELDSIAEPGTPESRTEWMSKALELVAGPASRGIDAETQVIAWAYRTIGRRMPAPSLVAIWALCHANANGRRDDVLRVLGQHWGDRPVSELGEELFRLVLENPGGVEIARLNPDDNLAAHIGYADGRVRLSPEAMMGELERAIDEAPAGDDGEFPLILGNGLRTRWTANTIQRSPDWRKGRGPHCMLTINPEDAERFGIADGQNVRLCTSRGSAELPAVVDVKMRPGHVAMPNGFGMQYDTDGGTETLGVNMNELTDTRDRDSFTGCPHHRYVRCRVEPAAQAA